MLCASDCSAQVPLSLLYSEKNNSEPELNCSIIKRNFINSPGCHRDICLLRILCWKAKILERISEDDVKHRAKFPSHLH